MSPETTDPRRCTAGQLACGTNDVGEPALGGGIFWRAILAPRANPRPVPGNPFAQAWNFTARNATTTPDTYPAIDHPDARVFGADGTEETWPTLIPFRQVAEVS